MGGYMWGQQNADDSLAAMAAATAAGVNWIDTAPLYGDGLAEELLGRFLKDCPPSQRPLVFTKFGHWVVNGERVRYGRREQVIADCEASLRRLGVERLDGFQLHWPTPDPVEETAAACADLLKAGKIGCVGLSNVSLADLDAWRATGVPLACVQNYYSLFRRGDEQTVLPRCAEDGLGYLAYSPLHRGLLFGTWDANKTFPAGDHRGERPDFTQPRLGILLAACEQLKAIGEDEGLDLPELAVGALLSREGCTAVIIGARNGEQGEVLGDLGMPLKTGTLDRIEAVLTATEAQLAAPD
jgi:aryl-alcohol dehydrogenase-like predicted oxidoreductase